MSHRRGCVDQRHDHKGPTYCHSHRRKWGRLTYGPAYCYQGRRLFYDHSWDRSISGHRQIRYCLRCFYWEEVDGWDYMLREAYSGDWFRAFEQETTMFRRLMDRAA